MAGRRRRGRAPAAGAPLPLALDGAPAAVFPTALFRQTLELSSDEQGWAHLGPFAARHAP